MTPEQGFEHPFISKAVKELKAQKIAGEKANNAEDPITLPNQGNAPEAAGPSLLPKQSSVNAE